MKKTILFLIGLMITSGTIVAQIPNNSFENWATVGSYSNPTSWGTMNNTTATYSIFTANQATPGNPGTAYLKLTSKTASASVVNGVAVCGKLDTITMKPKSGFAFSQQPQSFTGTWQHMIFGSSQGSVKAVLTKWNVSLNKRDTVAIASQTLVGMAMSWATFSINFIYSSGVTPDSCIIELRASGSNPTNNDYLWVDDLAFSGSVTSLNQFQNDISKVIISPNPSDNNFVIEVNSQNISNLKFELTDFCGKKVKEINSEKINGDQKFNFNADGITKGTYFLKISNGDSVEIKKIIIN